MAIPLGCPSTITPADNHEYPNLIPSDEDYIYTEPPLPIIKDIQPVAMPLTKDPTTEPSNETLQKNSVEPLSIRTLNLVHKYATNLLPIPPSSTPASFKNRTKLEALNLHRIFRCRQFCNQKHLTAATNASLVNSVLLPSTFGSFSTIVNPPKGKPTKKRRQYLDKFHMEIVFGDCVVLGGHRCALILVDVATRYCWLYGMSYISSTSIDSALEIFKSEAGKLPKRFHSNFNRKLIGVNALLWVLDNRLNIIAAPEGCQ